jgi:hypothetical protein
MLASTPKRADPFRLALFWFGIQAVWGALLGISLQARMIELAGSGALIAYGRLAAAGAAVAACVQVLAGMWSDRHRAAGSLRTEFYAAGALAAGAAIVSFYSATSVAALTISYLFVQGAMNLATGPYQAVIPDFVQSRLVGVASAWMAALQSAGNAAGALAAALVGNGRMLGALLGGVLIGTGAITSAHVRDLRPQARASGRPPVIARPFVDLFVSRALVYVGFYTLLGYLLFYVRGVAGAPSLAAARRESGMLILAFTVVGALGAALAARPSDRFDKRLVAGAGGILVCAALGLFIASRGWLPALVATLIAGVGWGVFLVADWALACRLLPIGRLATTMGVWNLAVVVPQIVAPSFTTAILVHFGLLGPASGPRSAFGLALGETLLGIAWLSRLSACTIRE